MKIKWINKYSGESGYVKAIKPAYFEATYNLEEAKKFRASDIDKTIEKLIKFEDNNDYFGIKEEKEENTVDVIEPEQKKKNKTKESMRKAIDKYNAKFDEIKIRVKPDIKDRVKAKAEEKGMSVQAYIISLMNNDYFGIEDK